MTATRLTRGTNRWNVHVGADKVGWVLYRDGGWHGYLTSRWRPAPQNNLIVEDQRLRADAVERLVTYWERTRG